MTTSEQKDQHQRSVKTLGLSGHGDRQTIAQIKRLLNHYELGQPYEHNLLVRIKWLTEDVQL